MPCGQQVAALGVVNFVVEHNLGGIRRPIVDGDTGGHSIDDGTLVLKRDIHQRGVVAVVEYREVVEPILPAECLAGIFEVHHVVSMPYNVHGIHLAESYLYLFCCAKLFHRLVGGVGVGECNFHLCRGLELSVAGNGGFHQQHLEHLFLHLDGGGQSRPYGR